MMIRDIRGNIIETGDRVAYPVLAYKEVWLRHGTVVNITEREVKIAASDGYSDASITHRRGRAMVALLEAAQ
jgi:hypothetical protein